SRSRSVNEGQGPFRRRVGPSSSLSQTAKRGSAYLNQLPACESYPFDRAVTETAERIDGRALPFAERGWVLFAGWVLVWNAAMPIRLIAMMGAPPAGRMPVRRMIGMLTLDQTTWAIVTYLVFRMALGARR